MRLAGENLGGERGGEVVFSGISFTLDGGHSLIVTGPNGSGKSTLLRVLCGLLPVATGRAFVEGGDERAVAPSCHYLGHRNAMKPALSVQENLAFWRAFGGPSHPGDAVPSTAEALETVGLAEIGHLPFAYLSAGQRRRVAIARLLLVNRPIWLLDEPTTGLDQASEQRFASLMRAHCAAGGIVVAATHLPLGLEGAQELRMGNALPSPQGQG